ncbi:MAG TPA: GTPase Era [Anaerolineales bacterium]|nr:GTPase Era [Anaerolineales bacterium]
MQKNDILYKTGFIAMMGRPNVGKSTLINAILRQKIAAVSPRPQTTRKRQMGILTFSQENMYVQAVFVDTPGVHRPHHKLGELMNKDAAQTLEESDLILFVADASQPPQAEDQLLFELIRSIKRSVPIILALNKMDQVSSDRLQTHTTAFLDSLPFAKPIPISATQGENLDELVQTIVQLLPEGEPFFPEDQLTDLYERDLAADMIREAALNLLRDEVPHGIAIRIDQYTEREDHGAYIEATLFVERESHKPIVIGQNGSMLKKIGTAARQEIEAMSGRKVFLKIQVKLRKNWRDDDSVLKRFGY